MRIVVTGGAGFVGSHLCEKLLALGHQVCCIDNLVTGNRDNIRHLERDRNFAFHLHDVSTYIEVNGPVDAIANLASPASPRDYLELPIQTLKVGSLGTHNALGLAKAKGARFLQASTSEVYGDPLVNPQLESYWGNVNPIGPRSVYDEAKRVSEALVMAYHRAHGVDTRIARIFNTYGPQMRPHDGRVISNFIVQALQGENLTVYGDGSQTRSFCFVSDLVEGLTALLLTDPDPSGPQDSYGIEGIHGPVNLGNPVEMKIVDIARQIIEVVGSSSQIEWQPLPLDDPKVRCPDITRARRLLRWEPRVSLQEGLATAVKYFRQLNKASTEEIPTGTI